MDGQGLYLSIFISYGDESSKQVISSDKDSGSFKVRRTQGECFNEKRLVV